MEHAARNVASAIALDGGLVAPAIANADTLDLNGLKAERERLQAAALAGRLTTDEIFSATFTISNLGPFGITRFRALVIPPQAAILAVGGVGESGRMSLSLSCDHRVLDGAPAAMFLGDVVGRLEAVDWLNDLL